MLTKPKQYDYSVGIIRVFALILVLLLHLRQSTGYSYENYPWILGVPLFLTISGYLYGMKSVENVKLWYLKRFVRILVPYYFLLTINIIISYYTSHVFSTYELIKGVFCVPAFKTMQYGMAHTWYLTYAILTYLLVPFLHWIFGKLQGWKNTLILFVVMAGILVTTEVLSSIPFVGNLSAVQINLFVGAFYISKRLNEKPVIIKALTFIVSGTLCGILFWLGSVISPIDILKALLKLYLNDAVTMAVFGGLLLSLSLISWKEIYKTRFLRSLMILDQESYYVYLVHYWFTAMSWWNVFKNGLTPKTIILYFALIAISTFIFGTISKQLEKFTSRCLLSNT